MYRFSLFQTITHRIYIGIQAIMASSESKDPWGEEIYISSTQISSFSSPMCKSESQQLLWHNYNRQDDTTGSSSASTPLSLPNNLETNDGKAKRKAQSLYSWTDMYGCLKQAESQCSVVPSLELGSHTSTIDYLCGGVNLRREPQMAFENWCASKQRKQQLQLQIQRKQTEQKLENEKNRKKLATLCYEQWLRNKKEQASKNHRISIQSTLDNSSNSSKTSICNKGNFKSKIRNVSQSEIRQVVESWWLKKKEQQQRQYKEKERHLLKKRIEEQRRKKLVEEAWQNWISTVQNKPKPVPFNQGVKSLRGTISPLYINPEPWKPLKIAEQQNQTGKKTWVNADLPQKRVRCLRLVIVVDQSRFILLYPQ